MRVRALTLIEVVAALALLAGALTALLVAQTRGLKQLQAMREQERAAVLAEELIQRWKIEPPTMTDRLDGAFESAPGWWWLRAATASSILDDPDVRQVTLSIYRRETDGLEHLVTTYTWLERVDASAARTR